MSYRLEIEPDESRAEAEPERPRRRPFRAVLLVIAIGGIAGGSYWAYRSDKLAPAAGPVPVIHSDAAPVKEAPKNPGGMIVPDQDSVLLNRDGRSNAKVEQLLPEAEAVLPRPVAPPPKPAPPLPQQAAVQPPPPPVPPIAAVVTPAPSPAVAAAPAVITPPAPQALPAKPAVQVAPPPASGGNYRLQLGALKSEEAAKQEWERLKRQQPDILGKLSLSTSRVDLGEKGIYYRIQAGPIADAGQAAQSCAALKSRNVGCLLVKP